jgi:hypothetical protein
MSDEKDRYGDKLRDVEKGREDQYFADRDRKLLQQLKTPTTATNEKTVDVASSLRCPKDGSPLAHVKYLDVTVEECPDCHGVWLDKGDLEDIGRREHTGWFGRYLGRKR